MSIPEFIAQMPKVELHVHLEGSIRPETLLKLAKKHAIALPADSVEGLRNWYRFRDFNHFVEIYVAASSCIRTPADLELVAREFVDGQIAQNVMHSEVTYTAETIERRCGIPWRDQLEVLKAAREDAKSRGVSLRWILDIVREVPAEVGMKVADWAIEAEAAALGLSGVEADTPAERHKEAFRKAKQAGLKVTTHAGETSGPKAIWDCLNLLGADRIGHGIRCLEDDSLVQALLDHHIHLEVCPSSNVCLGNAPSIALHPIENMLARGLNVSVNSDDPPMFNTTVTREIQLCAEAFGWTKEQVVEIQLNTIDAAFATKERRGQLEAALREFAAKTS
jgi:adenosine deaminase